MDGHVTSIVTSLHALAAHSKKARNLFFSFLFRCTLDCHFYADDMNVIVQSATRWADRQIRAPFPGHVTASATSDWSNRRRFTFHRPLITGNGAPLWIIWKRGSIVDALLLFKGSNTEFRWFRRKWIRLLFILAV